MKNLTATVIKSVNGGCWSCFSCCRPKVIYVNSLCTSIKPIYISRNDVISDSTLRQIFEVNAVWEKMCGNEKDKII